jgi:iron(III) transport system permease protein
MGGDRGAVRALNPVVIGTLAVVSCTVLVPIGYLLYGTFFDEGSFTLDFFDRAYGVQGLGSMLGSSVWFAAGSTAIAVAVGTLLAFLVVRTDAPLRRVTFVAALVPLFIPGLLYTIAWIMLASPRSGLFNELLDALPGDPTVDIFGMAGMMVVQGLHLVPLAFLLMAAAFGAMDGSLEEAAIASGARLSTVFRRITLPLARPALVAAVLVMMVRALESFEVPALLGIPGGVWVFTSRIWRALSDFPMRLGEAGAYSLSLLVLTSIGVLVSARLVSRGRRFETIGTRAKRVYRIRLGRWRAPATALIVAYALVAVVLPLLVLLYASTQPYYSAPSLDGLSRATLSNYGDTLGDAKSLRAFGNSLLLGVGAATAVMATMVVAAWFVVRTRVRGRSLVDGLASLPLAVPGLVLGTALVFVALRSPLPLYGTLWILLIAYFTRFMPYGIRFASASMRQVATELEDAARASGASFGQAMRRVLVPLLLPGLAAGWIYVLIVSMRELSASILVYSPGKEVLSVRIFEQYEAGRFTDLAALGALLLVVQLGLVLLAYRLSRRVGAWAAGAPA